MKNPDLVGLSASAAGAFLIACCVLGPLLIGAACVASVGLAVEGLLIGGGIALWAALVLRARHSRRCCSPGQPEERKDA
jgi:hypothetical protein